ncbi:MAG TPA: NAD(P)-dependent oxidoreductase [Acidimicrobiales bacterium]|nr:NAD(P)-dependent oxidoreductase [Acidimicrobiales bacterium]
MLEVGVIGLGNIGGNLAQNLVADGHRVTVFDLDAERVKAIDGASPASSVADVARVAEVTLTSLPDPNAVTAVAKEWASAAPPGAILCDLSTTLPASNQTIARSLAATGHQFVEAPLSGGAIGAKNRGLVFMVGGDDAAVARVTPIFETLGRATFHLGPVGAGTTMKLATSLMAFSGAVAAFEALSLTTKAGIDVRTASDIVKLAGPSNYFLDRAIEGINTRGKPTEFALRLAAKDAGLINEIGEATGVPTPAATAVLEFLADAVNRGFGDNDWSDLVLAAEARAGVELTIAPKADT